MTKAELKKEYKKYAKQNKTKGYTFGVIAAIVVLIGAVIVMPVAVLSLTGKIDIVTHFTYIIPGGIIVLVGMILDIIAEVCKSKELKEFSEKQ